MRQQKDMIKRLNVAENLEREKRKREWKKLNIMAKDKLTKERLVRSKEQQTIFLRERNKERIFRSQQRNQMIQTLQRLKADPFSPQAKHLI